MSDSVAGALITLVFLVIAAVGVYFLLFSGPNRRYPLWMFGLFVVVLAVGWAQLTVLS